MISILERYIAKNTMIATGFATLIIAAVLFLMMLLGEFKNIGQGDYGITQAIFFVFLRLPNELYQFSPMLILLGGMTGLSILSSHRELAVMRAYGFSTRKIIYSVLGAALILVLCISLIGEWIAPTLSYKAELNRENAQNAGQAVVTSSGVWLHVDNNFIHVEHVIGRQLLEGVTRYQFDDKHHLLASYYAKTLAYEHNHWVMHDIVKTSFYHQRTKSTTFPQADWDVKFNLNLFNLGLLDPNEMSLPRLAKFSQYLEQNGLQASEYRYEYWQRVFKPLASLIMIFLAIPFVLGTLSTSTLGWRIIVGILIGFAFFISNAFLGQLCIVYQLPAIFAAVIPLLLFAGIGVMLSKRMIRR